MFGIIGYSLLSNNFKFIKFGLSEYAEEPRFGSFNLYNSEVLRYFFEDIFLRTPHTTHYTLHTSSLDEITTRYASSLNDLIDKHATLL